MSFFIHKEKDDKTYIYIYIYISKAPLRGVPAIALDLSLVIQIHQKLGRDLGSILEGLGLEF